MSASKSPSLRVDEKDLKCKEGCGFYGNPVWKGYCSKCYKAAIENEKTTGKTNFIQTQRRERNEEKQSSGFNKFQEKKAKQITDKKTTRTLERISSLISKPSKSVRRNDTLADNLFENPELDKVDQEYEEFFANLKSATVHDIKKQVNNVISLCISRSDKSIDELSELIQDSYKVFSERMELYPTYYKVTQDEKEVMLDYFEKYIMTCLYNILFCSPTTTDEEKDIAIQNRIRQLKWVGTKHLDCKIDETNAEVCDLVYTAITDLLGLDSAKAPVDKLACVVKCCRNIFLILQQSVGEPASADEFLPALIFIVLKANPARFKSNVNYITKFCNESRLVAGEGGYYFTNLCCALSFVENLTAESLSMSEKEFDECMSGDIVLPNIWDSCLFILESMHLMNEHFTVLTDLRGKHESLEKSCESLREEMMKFRDDVAEETAGIIARAPLIIKPRKTPFSLDHEDPIIDDLPAPILPEILPTENVSPCKNNVDDRLRSVNYDIDFGGIEDDVQTKITDYLEESTDALSDRLRLNLTTGNASLLDSIESPSSNWLPSPLKPTQSSFSTDNWDIPSIPCNTGEFNSQQNKKTED